ncbi:MAG: hypothetical protein JJ958_06625 [Balneola sp.]|nr:hypothetical protein [Balneola sp.]
MATAIQDKKRNHELKKCFAIAKESLGMDANTLRETVEAWGFPRLSRCTSADLRAIQAKMRSWFKARDRQGLATQKQLDLLQDLWKQKSHKKDRQSLINYLFKKTGLTDPTLFTVDEISNKIQGLQRWP